MIMLIGTFIVTAIFIYCIVALFKHTDWQNEDLIKWLHNL